MLHTWWDDILDFFGGLPPDFAFLLALPFFVAGVAFVPDLWRRWTARPTVTADALDDRASGPARRARAIRRRPAAQSRPRRRA